MTSLFPKNWLKPLQRQSKVCRRSARRPSRVPRPIRPRLEQLEDRLTPSVFTASSTVADGAAGSLRDAVNQANADNGTATDTIQLSAGTYTLTIPNTASNHDVGNSQGDLNISNAAHAFVIQGTTDASGNPTTIIQQTVLDRVFQILNLTNGTAAGPRVTFKNLIIEGGTAQDDGGAGAVAGQTEALGGGILNGGGDANLGTYEGGNVTLSNVVVRSNFAAAGNGFSALGGGIYSVDGSLTINHSVIQNNKATDGGEDATYGGGVAFELPNNTTAQLVIFDSTVANNSVTVQPADGINPASGSGGGIALQGNLTLSNSTIAGNSATNQGGGIFFREGATGVLTNDTVSGNQANEGGGLDNDNGGPEIVTLVNTLVAGNSITNNAGAPSQDITADNIVSGGNNLIGISNNFVDQNGNTNPTDLLGTAANPLNPNLGPLQNNGGTTLTMALLPGSPAIGKGATNVPGISGATDQRGPGFPREVNGTVDIGAYQTQPKGGGGGGGGGGSNGGGGGSGTTQPPPSLFQAVFTLFLDGIYDELDVMESGGIENPILTALDQFLGDPSSATLQASINFIMNYAGPFGQFALTLGEAEVKQIVPPSPI